MGGMGKRDAPIQAFFPPTPCSAASGTTASPPACDAPGGDGFTTAEAHDVARPTPIAPWRPPVAYAESDIGHLSLGPRAVTFTGRVANIYDVAHTPKTPRAAQGCLKLCVKDDTGAITVRLWFVARIPNIRLGSLVSVWVTHVSNGENGSLSSTSGRLFVSIFPERDRSCYVLVREDGNGSDMCRRPLGFCPGQPLPGLMTLENFINGGYDVVDAKVLVVIRSVGVKKRITRKDGSGTANINLQVQDDTADATLGLWGTAASSPFASADGNPTSSPAEARDNDSWKSGQTVLLLQGPGWKLGRTTYLSMISSTVVDVDPHFPDADWLRRWGLRQRSREAINPLFPEGTFDLQAVKYGPLRCLYNVGELDECARAAPHEIYQGYLSMVITEVKLYECWKRHILFSGECCNIRSYANATTATCKGCDQPVELRLNPRILGELVDETACIGRGKLLFSNQAWQELLGQKPADLLALDSDGIKYISDRLLFCRVTLLFGWTGDGSKAGERICVMGVHAEGNC